MSKLGIVKVKLDRDVNAYVLSCASTKEAVVIDPGLPAAKIAADRGSPALEQLALADLITRGEFDRHLRRMRPVYRRRRDVLLTALRERAPSLAPAGIAAGLHLVAWLPPSLDEATVVAAAARGRR